MYEEFLINMNNDMALCAADIVGTGLCDSTSCHCDCIGGGCYCITD